jgi:hypothetical protein
VSVFDPGMPAAAIQARIDEVFAAQEADQFGAGRHALLFLPGRYRAEVDVGFYTQVAGLGATPGDVTVDGHVRSTAEWWPDGTRNATQNFWRAAEGLTVAPPDGLDRWAVSQAAPYRRMRVLGDLALSDGGWSSGGFLADSWIEGKVLSGSQQQWFMRNSRIGEWIGGNWNHVFVGVTGAPPTSFPSPPITTVGHAPIIAEKPFLYATPSGSWHVRLPAVAAGTRGPSWVSGASSGSSLPLGEFDIVRPGSDVHDSLSRGRNVLFTPGVYELGTPLVVDRPGTVLLGLGFATLRPVNGGSAVVVGERADDVRLAGLLVEAGGVTSPHLLEVDGDRAILSDVFCRIGGAVAGGADVALRIGGDGVTADHVWLWRADHGLPETVGWDTNPGRTGLVVDGDDVVCYGLFAEHFQEYHAIWNGERGRTYFYQNELPYDPPSQRHFMNGDDLGWAAYKVADDVRTHQAWGLGSYCFFDADPTVICSRAFEAPDRDGVTLRGLVTVSLGGVGTIGHVLNDRGPAVHSGSHVAYLP